MLVLSIDRKLDRSDIYRTQSRDTPKEKPSSQAPPAICLEHPNEINAPDRRLDIAIDAGNAEADQVDPGIAQDGNRCRIETLLGVDVLGLFDCHPERGWVTRERGVDQLDIYKRRLASAYPVRMMSSGRNGSKVAAFAASLEPLVSMRALSRMPRPAPVLHLAGARPAVRRSGDSRDR